MKAMTTQTSHTQKLNIQKLNIQKLTVPAAKMGLVKMGLVKMIRVKAGMAGIAALVWLAGGCGHPAPPTSRAAATHSCHLYAGLDTSASWRPT